MQWFVLMSENKRREERVKNSAGSHKERSGAEAREREK